MFNNLQSILSQQSGTFSGIFRVRYPAWGQTRHGDPYVKMSIEDNSASIHAYCCRELTAYELSLRDLMCSQIEGRIREYKQEKIIQVVSSSPFEAEQRERAIQLIPMSLCPQPWLLSYLESAVERITIAPLRTFVNSVLADDSIAFPYIACPASLKHHHNYPGGLLAHSLECFQMVEKHYHFPRQDYELGLVSALFHDIGKILTMTHTMKRTTIGATTEHEKLTFEVLAPYLQNLADNWPAGEKQLRYLLSWKLKRRIPRYNMADLVACCDRISAGADMQKKRLAS
nr:HD domain-containing protein [uncultured Desulfuromonas sp.]